MGKTGVLIAEDDSCIRNLLREYLEAEGYPVFEAATGKLALEQLRAHPEGLVVLLDLLMPANGRSVLNAVVTEAPLAVQHAYILMTAVSPAVPEQVRPLLQGLDMEAIHKPFDLFEMENAIQKAARRLGHEA
jgi:CheY-like chemotaxis protein